MPLKGVKEKSYNKTTSYYDVEEKIANKKKAKYQEELEKIHEAMSYIILVLKFF